MASPVPAKSQPLHNFSLPHLKWRNHRTGRSRLAGDTSSSSPPPPPLHRSPSSTPWRESSSPSSHITSHAHTHTHTHAHAHTHQSSAYVSEQNGVVRIIKPSRKLTKVIKPPMDNSKGKRTSNKICIRIRKNDVKHDVTNENHTLSPEQQNAVVPSSAAEEDESSQKIWNLRPRRPPISHKQSNIGSLILPENRYYSHGCNKNNVTKEVFEGKNNEFSSQMTSSRKHNKLSISLSRDEIEEDIFALTGAKPSRRPKKRPRTVQRQLDSLFPGVWLGSITGDTYKVSETRSKV